ncbi:hypothetical protein D9611_002343 [Ephemerocybe angulata]|uniref:Rab proteins geranylgeranyltransferase component A n=1 Tax=Ephemerocybe angulata TaxID=980116 RepID=A0A8H5C0U6_9AGAR|nr:hypothetical protein D9611_002343 [Tulosesus angulatus]
MATDDDNFFDAIIVGTGLTESVLAAALSKAKYKVAHIDPNSYYGGNEASLSQDELLKWGEEVSRGRHPLFSAYSGSSETLPFSRQYSICLRPSVIPALGPLITGLIASGVSKYSGFKLLDSVSIYSPDGTIKPVPGSKEAVFNNKDISLIEKRRLMRFLTFAASDFEGKTEIQGKEDIPFREFLRTVFSLSENTVAVIVYSLAHCVSTQDRTLPSLLRLRGYVHSIGRYGPSPFLVGHYGGIGDISQGFCRASAVAGGVYVLGRPLASTTFHPGVSTEVSKQESFFEVKLDDFPEVLRSRILVASREYASQDVPVPPYSVPSPPSGSSAFPIARVARCIAIVDSPLKFQAGTPATTGEEDGREAGPIDSGLLVIPPGTLSGGSQDTAATVFVNGENSLSTPKGRWIVYIALPLTSMSPEDTPESILRPYLEAVLQPIGQSEDTEIKPLSTSFFFENQCPVEKSPAEIEGNPRYFLTPPLLYSAFPDLPDVATRNAEATFQVAVKSLRAIKEEPPQDDEELDFWPPVPVEENSDDEDS